MLSLLVVTSLLVALTLYWQHPGGSRNKPSSSGASSKSPFRGRFTRTPQKPSYTNTEQSNMTRCHNCFSYFPEFRVVHVIVEGHILEFCSESCKRNFQASGHF